MLEKALPISERVDAPTTLVEFTQNDRVRMCLAVSTSIVHSKNFPFPLTREMWYFYYLV